MSRLLIAICVLVGLTHSVSTVVAADDDKPVVIGNAVVFTYYEANQWTELSLIGINRANWTPNIELVTVVNDQLVEFLTKQSEWKKILGAYSNYRRQYIGVTEGSKDYIVINSFCYDERIGDAWKRQIIHVFGGGLCYFTVWYDVANRGFFDFKPNADY